MCAIRPACMWPAARQWPVRGSYRSTLASIGTYGLLGAVPDPPATNTVASGSRVAVWWARIPQVPGDAPRARERVIQIRAGERGPVQV